MASDDPNAPFAVGDRVTIQNSELEVSGTGKVSRVVSATKCAVLLDGSDRSRIIDVTSLQRCTASPTNRYRIAGSWNDWQQCEMFWNWELDRLEYRLVLASAKAEYFNFVLEGDWDSMVYPSVADANPYVEYELHGPDTGNKNNRCWAIGRCPEDGAATGACYDVFLYLSRGGDPLHVDWERAESSAVHKVASPQKKAAAAKVADDARDVARLRRVRELEAHEAAELARDAARQTGPEGRFKVMHDKVACRSGPTTAAPIIAVARRDWVIRGTPHKAKAQPWLHVDQAALRKLGSRKYTDPGEEPPDAWVLMHGHGIGLGVLLEATADGESSPPATPRAGPEAAAPEARRPATPQGWEYSGILGAKAPERKEGEISSGPGKTACLLCRARAETRQEQLAHMRETGHTSGFYL